MNTREKLMTAVNNGDLTSIRVLIETSSMDDNHEALCEAAGEGHLDVVKALIPVSDPNDGNFAALSAAAEGGYREVVKVLVSVSNVKEVMENLIDNKKLKTADILTSYLSPEDLQNLSILAKKKDKSLVKMPELQAHLLEQQLSDNLELELSMANPKSRIRM